MLFESSCIYKAIKENSIHTSRKTITYINEGVENVNARSSTNETYLHLICNCFRNDGDAPNLLPVVFQLSNAGIDVNAIDSDKNTALHIAAKTNGTRKLIRALLMIGVDPTIKNGDQNTASQLSESIPENQQVLHLFSPGMLQTLSKNTTDTDSTLLSNWCKVDQSRRHVKDSNAGKSKDGDPANKLQSHENTVSLVHYALAGDRKRMRPLFNKQDVNVNVNTTSSSYIDSTSGDFIAMPLIGEAALLCHPSIVRKLLRKKASLNYSIGNIPLAVYIIQNIQECDESYEIADMIMQKVDFMDKVKDTDAVIDAAYSRKLPMNTLKNMVKNGLDLFAADDDGHFLRDRILIKTIDESPKRIEKELEYVDRIVVDMATHGCMEMLQSLVERGYEHVDVHCVENGSVRQALARAVGVAAAERFFKDMTTNQRLHRNCCHAIELGHSGQAQKLVNSNMVTIRDRMGRTLLHKAAMFGLCPVLRHLLKVCPAMAIVHDKAGRTPLHWACAIEDGEDMAEALKDLGGSMDVKDKNGASPENIKAMSQADKDRLLEVERTTDYGLDVYLFYKYLDLKAAIRSGDLDRVQEVRSHMYGDVLTKDITVRMYQTTPPQKCLLQRAMDARRDVIAKYLLTQGMEWDVKCKDGDDEISLLEAARRWEMKAVEGYILNQLKKDDPKSLMKKLRDTVKETNIINTVKQSPATPTKAINSHKVPAETDPEKSKLCGLQ